jgi:hypothetical protein
LEDRGLDGRMGSKWILGVLARGCGGDLVGSGWGPMAGCCEHCDKPCGSCATELVNLLHVSILRRLQELIVSRNKPGAPIRHSCEGLQQEGPVIAILKSVLLLATHRGPD